nr:g-type lectin s-receptor-like serine/threonine-protein kinase [Quercus suber]
MGPVCMINFLSVLCCLCLNLVLAIDTIRSSQSIKDKDSDYIISNGSTFKLGFFSPVNSTNRYVGIWYNKNSVSPAQWVWVANRQKPLKDASGVLTIFKDGNIVILDGQKKILWSSEVTNSVVNSKAQLLDSGNLVLQDTTGTIIWESFQFPTNTMLPNMKISSNVRTGKKVQHTSWKSPSDPSIGSFLSGVQPQHPPQAFVWKDGSPFWRSGPWGGRTFSGMQEMYHVFQNGFSFVEDQYGTFVLSFFYVNMSLSHIVLTTQGDMELRYWDNEKEDWKVLWKAMKSECHFYGKCGEFGSCYSQNSPICSCLWGFKPNDAKEWNRGNWTSGCVRRTPLQCGRVNSTGSEAGKMDEFLKLKMMKVPDFAEWSAALEDDCRQQCLQNCSCIAYAYDIGIGCMSWTRNLIDTIQSSSSGVDLYIRLAYLELDTEGDLKKIVTITVGGFGPVYRGILSNGQEIAVKRLSKTSGQGLHGCCVEGEEWMLIYEYMPNKSLDAFLFDPQKENPLDWRKRFKIIEGIGRDFGTARIFRGDEDQANTRRVVGTYGYMSPEYAIEGLFSEKSDVFSFGVVLLEIVSGRKNTSFYNDEQSLSLLRLAWKLWNADNIVTLIDPMINEPFFEMEILRCIQITDASSTAAIACLSIMDGILAKSASLEASVILSIPIAVVIAQPSITSACDFAILRTPP